MPQELKPASQVPGLYRRRVGDMVVTALCDGYFDLPFEFFPGLEPVEGEQLLRSHFRVSPPRLSVNTYLVSSNDRLVLIDTGCGHLLGPTAGKLGKMLAAAGVSASAIDLVLVTHIHPDHTNGLLDEAGKAVFSRAEIGVPEADVAFWLSEENKARAPDELKTYFDWAAAAFAPYRGRLRLLTEGEAAPGIEAVPLPGHTPGHTGYLVHSGREQLLIWGDLVHSISIQAARPEVTFAADVDQPKARDTRFGAFDRVATDRLLIGGMHVEFPGFGYLTREGQAYRYHPEPWSPTM